jgi:hypothetical protein
MTLGAERGENVEPSVAFACAAPTHQVGEGGPDKLTIYQGQWAFCAYDARADGHQWGPTGGRSLSMLRQSLTRPKEPPTTSSKS